MFSHFLDGTHQAWFICRVAQLCVIIEDVPDVFCGVEVGAAWRLSGLEHDSISQ